MGGKKKIVYLGSERYKFCKIFVIKFIKGTCIFTVTDQPVDGREMFTLGQFLVQPPKYLNNTQSGRGDRVREITTRR